MVLWQWLWQIWLYSGRCDRLTALHRILVLINEAINKPGQWATWHLQTSSYSAHLYIEWTSTRDNLSSGVCEELRRRPAYAYAQTGQRLCYSLFRKYHTSTYYEGNPIFQACICSWGDWSESRFDTNPEDRLCHVEAQIWTLNILWFPSNKVFALIHTRVGRKLAALCCQSNQITNSQGTPRRFLSPRGNADSNIRTVSTAYKDWLIFNLHIQLALQVEYPE